MKDRWPLQVSKRGLMRTVKKEEHWDKAVAMHIERIQRFYTLLARVMMLCSSFQESIRK